MLAAPSTRRAHRLLGRLQSTRAILRRFGVKAIARPSLASFDTCLTLDQLAAAMGRIAHSGSCPAEP